MKLCALLLALAVTGVSAQERPWNSIVVRGNGTYDLHEGIKSEQACRESMCFVQWEMSCADHVAALAEAKHKRELAEIEEQKAELRYQVDHPCTVDKDGTKTCPTGPYNWARYDKNGVLVGAGGSLTMGYTNSNYDNSRVVKVAACFQDKP